MSHQVYEESRSSKATESIYSGDKNLVDVPNETNGGQISENNPEAERAETESANGFHQEVPVANLEVNDVGSKDGVADLQMKVGSEVIRDAATEKDAVDEISHAESPEPAQIHGQDLQLLWEADPNNPIPTIHPPTAPVRSNTSSDNPEANNQYIDQNESTSSSVADSEEYEGDVDDEDENNPLRAHNNHQQGYESGSSSGSDSGYASSNVNGDAPEDENHHPQPALWEEDPNICLPQIHPPTPPVRDVALPCQNPSSTSRGADCVNVSDDSGNAPVENHVQAPEQIREQNLPPFPEEDPHDDIGLPYQDTDGISSDANHHQQLTVAISHGPPTQIYVLNLPPGVQIHVLTAEDNCPMPASPL